MGQQVRIACGRSQKGEAPEVATRGMQPLGRVGWSQAPGPELEEYACGEEPKGGVVSLKDGGPCGACGSPAMRKPPDSPQRGGVSGACGTPTSWGPLEESRLVWATPSRDPSWGMVVRRGPGGGTEVA